MEIDRYSRSKNPAILRSEQLNTLSNEKYNLFRMRTANYMRKAYPPLVALRTDAELHLVADFAYERAAPWGLHTEREIWEYIIPICFLGSNFDLDLQFKSMITKAGWTDIKPGQQVDTEALRLLIDEWVLAVQDDYEPLSNVLDGALAAYLQEKTKLIAKSELPFEVVMNCISHLSPRRWQQQNVYLWMKWYGHIMQRAQKLELERAEKLAYCFGSFYFGFAFEFNPILPWARQTLLQKDASSEARIFAFAQAAQKHLYSIVTYKQED